MGRPSLPPGVYFRLMLLGFFEGMDSERGIAWRCADSLSLRLFLGYGIDQPTPDHSTLSRTRRLIAGARDWWYVNRTSAPTLLGAWARTSQLARRSRACLLRRSASGGQ